MSICNLPGKRERWEWDLLAPLAESRNCNLDVAFGGMETAQLANKCKTKTTMGHYSAKQVWDSQRQHQPPRWISSNHRQGLDHPWPLPAAWAVTALSQAVLAWAGTQRATAKNVFKHLPPLGMLGVKWKSLFGSRLQVDCAGLWFK